MRGGTVKHTHFAAEETEAERFSICQSCKVKLSRSRSESKSPTSQKQIVIAGGVGE